MTVHITAEALDRELRRVASENPDVVYEDDANVPEKAGLTCHYVRYGEPSCIVGRALAALGVPIHILDGLDLADYSSDASRWDEEGEFPPIDPLVDGTSFGSYDTQRFLDKQGVIVDRDAFVLGHKWQARQDNGETWGSLAEQVGRDENPGEPTPEEG